MPRVVVRASIVSPRIIHVDHILSTTHTIVVAAGIVERLAIVIDGMHRPATRKALGDGKGCHLSIRDADALAVDHRAETGVEPRQRPIVLDEIAGIPVRVRLEVEVTAGGTEIVRLNDNACAHAALQADGPILHQRRHQVG
ncbi:MAG: hypothetical protein QOH35_3179 [Acidobacteriaceae bacterium]|nr:hypothetical protein [Acidobacteriaceae bacterium]